MNPNKPNKPNIMHSHSVGATPQRKAVEDEEEERPSGLPNVNSTGLKKSFHELLSPSNSNMAGQGPHKEKERRKSKFTTKLADDFLKMTTFSPSFPSAIMDKIDAYSEVHLVGYLSIQKAKSKLWKLQLAILTSEALHFFVLQSEIQIGEKVPIIEMKNIQDIRITKLDDELAGPAQHNKTHFFHRESHSNQHVNETGNDIDELSEPNLRRSASKPTNHEDCRSLNSHCDSVSEVGKEEEAIFDITTYDGKVTRVCAPDFEILDKYVKVIEKLMDEARDKEGADKISRKLKRLSSLGGTQDLSHKVSVTLVTVNTVSFEDQVRDDVILAANVKWGSHIKMSLRVGNSLRIWLSNDKIFSMKIGPNGSISSVKTFYLEDGILVQTTNIHNQKAVSSPMLSKKNTKDKNNEEVWGKTQDLIECVLECLTNNSSTPPELKNQGPPPNTLKSRITILQERMNTNTLIILGGYFLLFAMLIPFIIIDRYHAAWSLVIALFPVVIGYVTKDQNDKENKADDDATDTQISYSSTLSKTSYLACMSENEVSVLQKKIKKQKKNKVHDYNFHLKRLIRQPINENEDADQMRKSALKRVMSHPLSHDLSPQEQELVTKFVKEVNEDKSIVFENNINNNHITETMAVRFLRARGFDYQVAYDLLKENLSIRQSLKSVQIEKLLQVVDFGSFHFTGVANDGTAICVFECARFLPKKTDALTVNFLITLVTDLACACYPTEALTIIVDCSNFSLLKNADLSQAAENIRVVNVCIPEMMARVFVLNPPYAVKGVWNFVKGLLDSRTVDKIRFLDKKEFGVILDFIDPQFLDTRFGGDLDLDFSVEHAAESTIEKVNCGNFVPVKPRNFDKDKYIKTRLEAIQKSQAENSSSPKVKHKHSSYGGKSDGNDNGKGKHSKSMSFDGKINSPSAQFQPVFEFDETCEIPMANRVNPPIYDDYNDRKKNKLGGMIDKLANRVRDH